MTETHRILLKGNGPEDDSGLDSHWEDSWVYDWRTPLSPEIGPDRNATVELPTPAPDPPQSGHSFAS